MVDSKIVFIANMKGEMLDYNSQLSVFDNVACQVQYYPVLNVTV